MKKGRRLLAILMAICLVCAYMPVSVFGDTTSSVSVTFRQGSENNGWIEIKNETVWEKHSGSESQSAEAVRIRSNAGYSVDWTGITLKVNEADILTDDIKNKLTSDEGYILEEGTAYALEDVEFRQDGGGNTNPSETRTVNFGSGSWTVGEQTVTANKRETIDALAMDEVITLTGFDVDTMQVKLAEEGGGFSTTLTVADDKTSLSAKNCESLPDGTLVFSVEAKSSEPAPGPGPEPGEDNQKPDNFGKDGYISFDVRGTDGSISYQCADSKENLSEEGWQSVSTENGWYVPIAKNLFGSTSKVFFRIKGGNSKHLDVDETFRILNENHQCKYNVLGTYNDDPNYDSEKNGAQPSEKIGLKDMYDNTNDWYIIPVDKSFLTGEGAGFVEFHWIDVMPISVEIDEASQYLIANGKTEIGIASGKGFGISVQNGSNVSIPLLEDTVHEGEAERYLIDLKVNRNYFIPELSINGNVYQTFDAGGGTNEFTNIAVAVPANEFKSMIAGSEGNIVIHLTVDKNVSVENKDVQASFNMISNGTIPDGVSMENLDADVALSATDSTLTEDEIAEGAARAFDITMSVESNPETEFHVPIDISIAGDFSGNENNYSVIREHEGETHQVLECHIEKGEDNDILTFSTSKFSKFTIVYKATPSSGGGATPAPSVPSDDTITNSGSGSDASTNVDVSDKTTVTDSKTETKVDTNLGNKIVENALKNNSTDVVINAGTSAGDSTGSTVTLPESTVKALAKDTEASVTIKTDSAEVSLDKDVVAAVAEQAGSEGEVKLVVETREQNKNKVEIELTLVTSNGTVSSFNGGTVTVTVPVSKELADKKVVCVYIDENGKYHKVDGAINEAGTHYTFTTGHFSTYAVMSEEEADAVIKQQTADEQKAKIKKVKATVTLSTKDLKKGIRVTVKVPEAQKADKTGIIIYRSTSKNAKTYAVYKKVATKNSTYIIRNTKNVKGQKLTSGKKYYYKVRAYKVIDGKTYYGPMSAVKYIKAK